MAIYHALAFLGRPMSLNDVCAYVPAWFGVSASLLTGALAAECSGSGSAGAAAALVMAIIPAHLMRSIGGGYDNESIAVTAMCLTFYVWVRSLRSERAWPVGALAGLAYIYMVAAWGGYVFVVNMIGAHAALLVLLGRLGAWGKGGGWGWARGKGVGASLTRAPFARAQAAPRLLAVLRHRHAGRDPVPDGARREGWGVGGAARTSARAFPTCVSHAPPPPQRRWASRRSSRWSSWARWPCSWACRRARAMAGRGEPRNV